jgi:hypothetical protein
VIDVARGKIARAEWEAKGSKVERGGLKEEKKKITQRR